MEDDHGRSSELELRAVSAGSVRDGYATVGLETDRGDIQARYYPVPESKVAALFVGGAGGGWDSPVGDLYPRTCEQLVSRGIAALRVRYRMAARFEECVLDVLAGVALLEAHGMDAVGLVGWSFGGAVVIHAAAMSPLVRTVVTVATQSYGAESAANLAPRCSLLLLHGTADRTLPPSCSQYVERIAGEPKRLILYPGADHGLSQARDDVFPTVLEWLVDELHKASQDDH